MTEYHDLDRFVEAQEGIFTRALSELNAGLKRSHWIWFIFPQIAGLGRSANSQLYALASLGEARAYLDHALLGARLRQSIEALLSWAGIRTAEEILGPLDALKLRSCLTLFNVARPDELFRQALDAFFNGQPDERTLALLNSRA